MKLLTLAILLVPIVLLADENEQRRDLGNWLKISVRVQNVARELERLQRLMPDTPPEPSQFDGDLKVITSVLSELVKARELEEKKIELVPPEVLGDEGLGHVMHFVESLSDTYGYFVAIELVDVGLRMKLSVLEKGKPIPLTLRLPPKLLRKFLAMAEKNNMLHSRAEGVDGKPPQAPQPPR